MKNAFAAGGNRGRTLQIKGESRKEGNKMAFEKLFQPIKIGPVEIKNRIAVAPMNCMGDRDGHPNKQYICYFNARALGGFGLITSGAIVTNRESHMEYGGKVPGMYIGGPNLGYWSEFTESIHSMGTNTKVFAQLMPGFGRQSGFPNAKAPSATTIDPEIMRKNLCKTQLAWSDYWLHDWAGHYKEAVPREMTIEEIHELQRTFLEAAELAIVAGFDGIQIHTCHGYVGHQFLSPRCNKRTDAYGGSLRNRARFLLELLTMCKKNFGEAVPIMMRLSGREYQEDGLTAEDVRQIIRWCEEAGLDAVDLSNGSGYDDMKHFEPEKDNIELLEAQGKKLKAAVRIPVITVGLHTPEVALKAVEEGDTDIVSLGRQALADPEWPNKVKEGRIKEIVRCTRDNFCNTMGIVAGRRTARCTQNPNFGKEEYMPQYWPKPMKARVPETLMRWKPGQRWKSALKPQ
jgi:2,4-dienoyl-CoA reductase-like NADH-dependent reductase (Old Yellow Enzyme family)